MALRQLLLATSAAVLLAAGTAAGQSATAAGAPYSPSTLGAGARFSMQSIRAECIPFANVKQGTGDADFRQCRVSESGDVGTVDGDVYYYAIYCLIPADTTEKGECGDASFTARYHRARALAVFVGARSGKSVRLLLERDSPDIGMFNFEKPAIVRSRFGTLLSIPIIVDGTGHGNESEYYLRVGRRWESIDGDSWVSELRGRIPAGLEIWKGIWPDLHTMQAEASLYRPGDANCCPTGGVARIRLAIRSGRFTIESVQIDRTP